MIKSFLKVLSAILIASCSYFTYIFATKALFGKPFERYRAKKEKDVAKVATFMQDGVDLNTQEVDRVPSLLHYVIGEKDEAIVRRLISEGADLKAKYSWGSKPLYIAIHMQDEAIVRFLLENGADANAKDSFGSTPLCFVLPTRNKAIVKLLLENGADANLLAFDAVMPLCQAIETGDEAIIKLLLENGADINIPVSRGGDLMPLSLAIFTIRESEAIVKLLLENGADVNAKNRNGSTPLECAIKMQNEAVVKLLLENGADVNAKDRNEATPLFLAINIGNEAIVKLLLENGADINVQNENGSTPLAYALRSRHEGILRLILKKGPDLNAVNHDQKTPFYTAFEFYIFSLLDIRYQEFKHDFITGLISLISWYTHYKFTNVIQVREENDFSILRYLKDSYQSYSVLQRASPLLSWTLSQMLDCKSQTAWIKKILEYLALAEDEADQQKQLALFVYMDNLFLLEEETLKEFGLQVKTFKNIFKSSVLEKFIFFLRHRYAQKLNKKIFKPLDQYGINNFEKFKTLELEKVKEDPKLIKFLHESYINLIQHCQRTQVKSSFVNEILLFNQRSKNEVAFHLVQGSQSEGGLSKTQSLDLFKIRMNDILTLIKHVKIHLNHIIEKNGKSLKSPAQFNAKEDLDILLFEDAES